jgi:hypothetical protein
VFFLAGSTQNLVDPARFMSMQEDARCRKISSEVMKRCLYRPDMPGRRRTYSRMSTSMRGSTDGSSSQSYARMFQSLPATPAQSLTVTPAHSPTNMRGSFFSFLSRGATPRAMTPETEEEEPDEPECDAGLASVLRPQPRYVCAFPPRLDESVDEASSQADGCQQDGIVTSAFAPVARTATNQFRNLSTKLCQNPMSS